jgi:hypothetical protein
MTSCAMLKKIGVSCMIPNTYIPALAHAVVVAVQQALSFLLLQSRAIAGSYYDNLEPSRVWVWW